MFTFYCESHLPYKYAYEIYNGYSETFYISNHNYC